MEVFYERGRKYNTVKNGKPYFRKSTTINGKRHTVFGDGEKDADNKIEELRRLAATGVDLDKRTAKTGDAFKYWLFNIKRVDKDIKDSSFARYECAFRNHVEPYSIIYTPLAKLDSAAMQRYVTDLYEEHGVSGAAIKATVKVWKMFTKWAVDEGYLVKDPTRNLSLPGKREKGKKVIETFTAEERAKIIQYMAESGYQYDTIIKLAFATGMRQGELLGLRWDDIDDEGIHVSRSTAMVTHVDKAGNRKRYREVWDTKTENSVRTIPLLPSTRQLLHEHKLAQAKYFLAHGIARSGYVFTTKTGTLIDATNFTTTYRRMLERAGVPYRKFHAIRHTFATEAIRNGVDVKDLQMLMGHSDVETTYVYVHSNTDSRQKAIERMGEMF